MTIDRDRLVRIFDELGQKLTAPATICLIGSTPGQVNRTVRTLYVDALDALLKGRMAEIAVARDWELLREVARLAQQDAPHELASTDPALYETWRAAVTKYHLKGWTHMTPERVDAVRQHVVDRRHASSVA
jgi:hypothetical protein